MIGQVLLTCSLSTVFINGLSQLSFDNACMTYNFAKIHGAGCSPLTNFISVNQLLFQFITAGLYLHVPVCQQ